MTLDPRIVYVVRTPSSYAGTAAISAPELRPGVTETPALNALRELLQTTGLDAARFSSSSWNPLGDIIGKGDRVLIKPNWVYHENSSGGGLDCLVTHSTLLEAVLEYVALAQPESIIVGDAPIQSCDFALLRERTGLDAIFARAQRRQIPVQCRDFRLLTMQGGQGGPTRQTERTEDQYVLFDLGPASYLEPVSGGSSRFRVTMYDPRALEATHGSARHKYLIAREVIDSNVVINLPKLKTHKKACITGALKNMVGVNGHKSYLPHHRKGGSLNGGDCYPGGGLTKSWLEGLLDCCNRLSPGIAKRLCGRMASAAIRVKRATAKSVFDLEGSWYGNDTVWRMVLDLQRILHYGRSDGTLAQSQQRTVLNLTDAMIGGQGDGPLAPIPASLGFVTLGMNAPATDWVNALLMGLDPARVPLTRAAFSGAPFSNNEPTLANFPPEQILVRLGNTNLSPEEAARKMGSTVLPPIGWVGHCEWEPLLASAL